MLQARFPYKHSQTHPHATNQPKEGAGKDDNSTFGWLFSFMKLFTFVQLHKLGIFKSSRTLRWVNENLIHRSLVSFLTLVSA